MVSVWVKYSGQTWQAIKHLMAAISILSIAISFTIVLMPQSMKADTLDHATWVGDVPIMPQLTIEPGLGFAFDNPEGRIVTIYLTGDIDPNQVMAYYDQALIPLGWIKKDTYIWHRRNESLTINKTPSAIKALWKIMLRPKS